jgi:hypothetical protein
LIPQEAERVSKHYGQGQASIEYLEVYRAMLQMHKEFDNANFERTSMFGHTKTACILYEKPYLSATFCFKEYCGHHLISSASAKNTIF